MLGHIATFLIVSRGHLTEPLRVIVSSRVLQIQEYMKRLAQSRYHLSFSVLPKAEKENAPVTMFSIYIANRHIRHAIASSRRNNIHVGSAEKQRQLEITFLHVGIAKTRRNFEFSIVTRD